MTSERVIDDVPFKDTVCFIINTILMGGVGGEIFIFIDELCTYSVNCFAYLECKVNIFPFKMQ